MFMKYMYFFSFNYGDSDYGNAMFELKSKIKNENGIKEVEKWLESRIGKRVIIMNFFEVK